MTRMQADVCTPADLAREALARFNAQDVAGAASLAGALVAARPNDLAAGKVLARAEFATGASDAAAKRLRTLRERDPLDVAALLLAAECAEKEQRTALLQEAYELEPSEAIEALLCAALGSEVPPTLSDSGLGRIYRRAGMHELAATQLQRVGPSAAVEELVERLWLGDEGRVTELVAVLRARPVVPLVALCAQAWLSGKHGDHEGASAAMETVAECDPELEVGRRDLPEGLVESLPLPQSAPAYEVSDGEAGLRLIPWSESGGPSEEAPQPSTLEIVSEERVEPRLPGPATAPAGGTEAPLPPASEAELLVGNVAAVPGVLRALAVDRTGRTLANAPARGADPIEAKLLGALMNQIWRVDYVATVHGPMDDVRLRAGVVTVHGLFDVIPDVVLVFVVEEQRFDAQRIRTAIAEALNIEEGR